MIDKKDIIECKSYKKICDYTYDAPNLDDIPPTGLVHVPLDQIEEFFKRIDSNGHRYVVVSSCSDFGLAIQNEHPPWRDLVKWTEMQVNPKVGYKDLKMPARLNRDKCKESDTYSVKCHAWTRATFDKIPNNVHHWFITNLMFCPEPEGYNFLYEADTYKKITCIPFGIAEGKSDELYEVMKNQKPIAERENKIYISWSDYTIERYELRNELASWDAYGEGDKLTVRRPDEPEEYRDYLNNMSNHMYCISPQGNGVDCYRTLEGIYMGCVVFAEDNPTNYLTGVPICPYKGVDHIISYYNSQIFKKMPEGLVFKEPRVKMSYWKNLIHSKRDEML